jgi:lipopolysaccharide export system protein LptA
MRCRPPITMTASTSLGTWFAQRRHWLLGSATALAIATLGWLGTGVYAQSNSGTLTLRADVQEANALTGVITARGNVQIEYPARSIYATAAQAQYFGEERRIILSGNVVVNQEGNRLEAETVTYLIDEGRFIALPQPRRQVRSTYIIPDPEPSAAAPGAGGAVDEPGQSVTPDDTLEVSPIDASTLPAGSNSN